MVVGEILCADDAMHVRFHEFLDEVDFGEGIVALRLLDIENGNDLLLIRIFFRGVHSHD